MYGWDFFDLEAIRNPEAPRPLSCHVEAAFDRCGVNTFCWHIWNPATGENLYDTTPAVAAILPGGDKHDAYRRDLDNIAAFAKNLRGKAGQPVPLIFRPFHEHTGSWFWWGQKHCTTNEFVALWLFTVKHLRDQAGVHNFLYAYSPGNAYGRREDYWERYPGDPYVDILGYD